jgi:hypothetical protein
MLCLGRKEEIAWCFASQRRVKENQVFCPEGLTCEVIVRLSGPARANGAICEGNSRCRTSGGR